MDSAARMDAIWKSRLHRSILSSSHTEGVVATSVALLPTTAR